LGVVDIVELAKEIDISTQEALAYVKYFDYIRRQGYREKWKHFTVRLYILSVSDLGNGYYSALRNVKDEVLFRDLSELERYQWLRGWIFQRDKGGQWYVVVDGETDSFDEFKRVYKQVKRQW